MIYSPEFAFSLFQPGAATARRGGVFSAVKLANVASQRSADLRIVEGIMSCFLKPTPIMDGSSSAFPKEKPFDPLSLFFCLFFLKKSPKQNQDRLVPHNPVPL